ncbi:hypothetical protein MMYC01_202605 [Madurella mycetomatis]|uniref:Fibroin-3 n=1 Tax=Madurella mycetomatis TaxID=100816 RepID=A0A175WAG6_9PEZI|nr:hypothetical protein MMYC01_202605 [Madurella mycetomatis]
MPAVNVAMERSLREGFLDLLAASVRPALGRRDLQEQITDVRTAFSSWDNCMQANFCKWPVIAVIIIGGLIIISVVWCIIRCACCGLSCCCSCFSCLKCCGNCCGCCDPPRGSRRKYLDEPYIPPDHGYKSHAPMHAGFGGSTMPATKAPDYPQYAEFDVGGKKNEDALPEMPSWEGAGNKKIPLEEEAVEMNALQKPEVGGQTTGVMIGAAAGTVMSSNSSRSPINRSPYGPPGAGSGSNGYFTPGAADTDPYAQGAPGYNQPGMAYGQANQGYGMGGAAMGPGRRSPRSYNDAGYNDRYNNGGYGQTGYDSYGAASQQPYDNYDQYGSQGNQGYGMSGHRQSPNGTDGTGSYPQDTRRSPAPQSPYGAALPYGADSRRSPAPQGDYRRSPGPGADYGSRRSPAPQSTAGSYDNRPAYGTRQYSTEPTQPLRAPPQRQYTGGSTRSAASPVNGPAPLQNDTIGGFDFTSGYSRPPALNGGGNGGYRLPSPGPASDQETAYPGYKPYQPTS